MDRWWNTNATQVHEVGYLQKDGTNLHFYQHGFQFDTMWPHKIRILTDPPTQFNGGNHTNLQKRRYADTQHAMFKVAKTDQ